MQENKKKDKEQSKIEHEQWLELCDYVHTKIMGYTKDMKFSKYIALRLRGLHEGNFIANKYIKPQANYPYDIILLTFKAKYLEITEAVRKKSGNFKDENQKFNYILAIVENSINDIVMRKKEAIQAKEKIENLNISIESENKAEYQPRKKKDNKRLKDLW